MVMDIQMAKIADDLRSTDALSDSGKENFKDHVLHTMMTDANGLKHANSAVLNKGDLSFNGFRAIYYVHQSKRRMRTVLTVLVSPLYISEH